MITPTDISKLAEAYIDGYYNGAGDDAWYDDHDSQGRLNLVAFVWTPVLEFIQGISGS